MGCFLNKEGKIMVHTEYGVVNCSLLGRRQSNVRIMNV